MHNEKTQHSTLKIACVTEDNAKDVHSWSGIVFFITQALERQGVDICYVDNLKIKRSIVARKLSKFYSKIIRIVGKRYEPGRTIAIAKKYAKEVENRIPDNIDVILAPAGTIPMAFLHSGAKKVIYNDATFACMANYYRGMTNLCSTTLKQGKIIDEMAFANCDLLLFASDWAAQSAIRDYHINVQKVRVVPFGANIQTERSEYEIKNIIKNRAKDVCNLLFVGVNWKRKGGNIALKIAERLHNDGINVHLDIVGIKKMPVALPDYATHHGFVSKSTAQGNKLINDLFENAHFLVLPTRQECFGIVFAEASSYGLPSIATKTGGVESAVKDNVNGMTFALGDAPEVYANYIKKIFANSAEYEKLCLTSFNHYKNVLNWDVAAGQIVNYINNL